MSESKLKPYVRKRSIYEKDKDQPDIKRLKISPAIGLSQVSETLKPGIKSLKPGTKSLAKKQAIRKTFVSSFIRTLHSIAIDENQDHLCHFSLTRSRRFNKVS